MSAILAVRGTVVDDQVPCCPRCGAITQRLGLERRQCVNRECLRVVQLRIVATGGNQRVYFSTDGSDPIPGKRSMGRRYTNRAKRTA